MTDSQKSSVGKQSATPKTQWTFLTNHSLILICLMQDSEVRLRDVAAKVGITERAVQRIVAELEEGGVIERRKSGRRNAYVINSDTPLRHSITQNSTVGDLLGGITP